MKVSIHTASRIGTRLDVARVSRVRVRLGVVLGLELGLGLGLGLFSVVVFAFSHFIPSRFRWRCAMTYVL